MKDFIKNILDNQVSRRSFIKGVAAMGFSLSSAKTLVGAAVTDKTYGWTGRLLRLELPSGKTVMTRTLDYGEDGRRAVQLFLDRGHEKGLLPCSVPLEFV